MNDNAGVSVCGNPLARGEHAGQPRVLAVAFLVAGRGVRKPARLFLGLCPDDKTERLQSGSRSSLGTS